MNSLHSCFVVHRSSCARSCLALESRQACEVHVSIEGTFDSLQSCDEGVDAWPDNSSTRRKVTEASYSPCTRTRAVWCERRRLEGAAMSSFSLPWKWPTPAYNFVNFHHCDWSREHGWRRHRQQIVTRTQNRKLVNYLQPSIFLNKWSHSITETKVFGKSGKNIE